MEYLPDAEIEMLTSVRDGITDASILRCKRTAPAYISAR